MGFINKFTTGLLSVDLSSMLTLVACGWSAFFVFFLLLDVTQGG